jgi:prolyl-tRNA editing enzyme YbaK/EbsC (Cys-tRNA(Pro) deacylase)
MPRWRRKSDVHGNGIGNPAARANAEPHRERSMKLPDTAQRVADLLCAMDPDWPFGETRILVDGDLMHLEIIWAAAGHPHAVFSLTPKQLLQMTGAAAAHGALRSPVN